MLIRLIFSLTLIFSAHPSYADTDLPGKGIKTSAVVSPIIEERFQTLIIEEALKRLGYDVQPMQVRSYLESYKGIAKNEFSYATSYWSAVHRKMLDDIGGFTQFAIKKAFISGAAQGYLIDKKTADKYQITTLTDFNKPEIAKLFDFDNDGKADFLGCEKIWECASVIEHQLDTFKLRNTISHHQNDYSKGVIDLLSRFQEGKSIFYYTWTPYWLSSILKPNEDVIWLEVPYSAYPNGTDTTLANGKNYGFKVNNIHIISLKTFTLQNPAAGKLFETASLSINEVSAQNKRIHDGENTLEDIQGHVNEWIIKNQKRFDGWIEKSLKAAKNTQSP